MTQPELSAALASLPPGTMFRAGEATEMVYQNPLTGDETVIATDEPKVVRRDKTTWCNSKGRTVLERQHDGNYHVPVIGYLTISELRDLHEAISGALALHEHISKADEAANEGA